MTTTSPPASIYLTDKHIHHSIFKHDKPIYNLAEAAKERNQVISQVVRSILFRISEGKYILVLTPGDENISWKKLRKYLNLSRITMASKEEVIEITGYPPGAVTPFGLKKEVPIYINNNILKNDEISIGSGEQGVAIIMKSSDIEKAIDNFTYIDFTKL